ncbi:MAG: NYN domain-containing protein [Candidatus Abawacabacteria bacterium]|nr:NYN domain-containing protein [Candidatus Abawacabacteria bacterium]
MKKGTLHLVGTFFHISFMPQTNIAEILQGRVSIFIDSSNVFYISKRLRVRIDYEKVLQFFRNFDQDVKCYFYSAYQEGYEKQMEYFATLEKAGIVVRKKPLKFITTPRTTKGTKHQDKTKKSDALEPEEEGFFKGNMDVELAIDAIRMMSQYDTFVLFSGDSDFHSLLAYLKEHGKNVVVISHPGFVAEELTETAHFINIGEYLRKKRRDQTINKPSHRTRG